MNINFNGRMALIAAAGLWMCVAAPMQITPGHAQDAEAATAAEATQAPAGKPIALKKFTRQSVAKKKVVAVGKPEKVKSVKAKATEISEDAKPAKVVDESGSAKLPLGVANANAQLPDDAAPDPFAQVTPAPTSPLQADTLLKSVGAETHPTAIAPAPDAQIVAADELNEIDRAAAAAEARPALTLASATIDPPVAAEAMSTDNSTWDKTSLIGKIFIAFGGLLTMASAARMFIA